MRLRHGPATRVTDLVTELGLPTLVTGASFPRLSWVGDEYVVTFDALDKSYLKSICD